MKLLPAHLSLSLLLASATAFAQPAVTAVLDGAALTANLAQGSEFIVKGTGLSNPAEYFPATAPTYPTTLKNVSISLTPTGGGAAISMLMAYTFNLNGTNQLAAVVPSTTALGNYNLKVTYNGASSANFATTVVARKPGVDTASSDGIGIAQATLNGGLTLQRNSNIGKLDIFDTRPAHPNDIVTLWGTGLGADIAADTGGSNGDQTVAGNIRVVLNGNDIVPIYAGRSQGYPGLDQVNFSLPSGVALGCSNTVQVRAAGVLSNMTTIATAAAGSDTCPSSSGTGSGLCPARANASTNQQPTQAEIDEWAASGQECQGAFSISRTISYVADYTLPGNPTTITKNDAAAAQFTKITGSDVNAYLHNTTPIPGYQIPAPGVCNIFSLNIVNPYPNLSYQYLDGGNPLNVKGPNGGKDLPRSTNSVGNIGYNATTGAGVPGNWMDPGAYTFSGPGSANIGSFSVNTTVPTEFVVTNAAALQNPINRSVGVTVNWTGGDPTQLVFITGSSLNVVGSVTTYKSFQCTEIGSAGHYTVPVSILQQLPVTVVPNAIFSIGSLGVSNITKPVRGFVSGIDYFAATSSFNYSFNPQYQ